jgi:hypothetical protein
MAATAAANELPCNCRAAYRQTYWTSAFRKSMSSKGMTAMEAGRKAGGGEVQTF